MISKRTFASRSHESRRVRSFPTRTRSVASCTRSRRAGCERWLRPLSPNPETAPRRIVSAVVDDALSPDFPLGDAIETFIRREDAERFIEEIRAVTAGDDPEAAAKLRIGARARAGGLS